MSKEKEKGDAQTEISHSKAIHHRRRHLGDCKKNHKNIQRDAITSHDGKSSIYRMLSAATALRRLYSLPKKKVEAFVKSYDVYNHDWSDEKTMIAKFGPDYYPKVKKMVITWYEILNEICVLGEIEKMYVPPAMDLKKGIIDNQNLFEQKMARNLHLKSGKHALDIGCGRGRIANHIASYTGAHVTGINIDKGQLKNARTFAASRNMSKQCEFKLADLNDLPLPFDAESFDAVYHVQVFSLSKDLGKLMNDIHRTLKPGGYFACLDWVSLPAYNPQDPKHASLMRKIKPLIGAIGTPTIKQYTDAIEGAGFEVLVNENASIDGLQWKLIANADKYFTNLKKMCYFLVKMRALPAHFKMMMDRFTKDGKAFIEGDKLRIVTTSHFILARKPKSIPQSILSPPAAATVSATPPLIPAK